MLERPVAEVEALYNEQSSMHRMVTAEDVADMAAFLAGPLSRNVNGQVTTASGTPLRRPVC